MGINEDSDMTYEEKKVKRMGIKEPVKNKRNKRSSSIRVKRDDDLPVEVDYRPNLAPIKNQGDCGACWAFSATSVLEYQIKTLKNLTAQLSEQELIDCNTDDMSCDSGGWPTYAFNYIIANGLAGSKNYQYLAYSNDCLNDRIKRQTRITDTCECKFV